VNITGGSSLSLFEVEEATEIIHEAAGEEANVILGAVIDDQMTDEITVTVIATGFNRKGAQVSAAARQPKATRPIERVPSGATDLQILDEPAYVRRGVPITLPTQRSENESPKEKIDKTDHDKPAFLRKVMD
jgi:cell division protein FtsZ